MLSTYVFILLFIIVVIILVAAAAVMLLWLAYVEPFRRRKKRVRALEGEVAMLREEVESFKTLLGVEDELSREPPASKQGHKIPEVESLKTLLGAFRTRSEAIEKGLFKLQESLQKRNE
jgi:flagellar biosynthesis/type III secretory pathway M-ring protein FliF/YscJ